MIEAEKWNSSALLASAKASPVQGEVGCFSNPEGLLLTCGLDKNFLVGDKLDNPSDIRGIAKAIPLEKALARPGERLAFRI